MSAVARASLENVVFVAPEVAYLGVAANCVTFRCRKAVRVHGDDPPLTTTRLAPWDTAREDGSTGSTQKHAGESQPCYAASYRKYK